MGKQLRAGPPRSSLVRCWTRALTLNVMAPVREFGAGMQFWLPGEKQEGHQETCEGRRSPPRGGGCSAGEEGQTLGMFGR